MMRTESLCQVQHSLRGFFQTCRLPEAEVPDKLLNVLKSLINMFNLLLCLAVSLSFSSAVCVFV